MSEAILVGLIGVLGVLVGGLITGGFSSYLHYRKEAQHADAKERKDELYVTQDSL